MIRKSLADQQRPAINREKNTHCDQFRCVSISNVLKNPAHQVLRRIAGTATIMTKAGPILQARLYGARRSEEHTSELQSRFDLVCRLLLEKKNLSCTEKVLKYRAGARSNQQLLQQLLRHYKRMVVQS